MQTIYELVTFEYQNEHDLEHTLGHKTQFSSPKIFDADGDLNKRWYVYFSYRNPETGKLVRQKNIYGKVNRFKTKSERYSVLNLYKKRLLKFLTKKSGERVKFRWLSDDEDGASYYFEIRIQVDEITKDVSLMITDFAEDDEIEEGKMLWDNQISSLKQVLGSR